MKHCPSCQTNKPTTDFASNQYRKDGLQTACRQCQKKWSAARYQLTKKEHNESNIRRRIRNQIAVYDYLKEKSCVDCGNDNPVVLTFDHVRGKKFREVSNLVKWSYGLKTIFDEIAKCEIRCFNCHMIKDSVRRGSMKWNALNAATNSGVQSVSL